MGRKCDNCCGPANKNIQKVWIQWDYNENRDEYSSQHEVILDFVPDNTENLHLCDKCLELWKEGNI